MTTTARKRGEKLNTMEREAAIADVAKLSRRGYSQQRIAVELGLGMSTVNRYVRLAKQRYMGVQEEEIYLRVQEKLAQYRDVMVECWEAWEQSKGHCVQNMIEQVIEALERRGFDTDGVVISPHVRLPSTQFLRIIMDCLQAERDLLGLDSPKEIQATVQTINWDSLAAGIGSGPVPDDVERVIEGVVLGIGERGVNDEP
jgi:predicted transcriptional regulator